MLISSFMSSLAVVLSITASADATMRRCRYKATTIGYAAPSAPATTMSAAAATTPAAAATPVNANPPAPAVSSAPAASPPAVAAGNAPAANPSPASPAAPTTTSAASPGAGAYENTSGKLVFAHYMLVTPPIVSYADDMAKAAAAGIDAFAVNYGGWGNNFAEWEVRLKNMYAAAEAAKYKLFLTFDMTSVTDPAMIVRLQNTYAKSPASLYYKDRLFMSTFANSDNPSFNWQNDVLNKIVTSNGNKVYFAPGTTEGSAQALFARPYADAVFNWIHPAIPYATDLANDKQFAAQRDSTKKQWMASIAPWFFKHYAAFNWANPQDSQLFYDKFVQYADPASGVNPDFIELVTWNDFGESSYFGPADAKGNYQTWSKLNHDAMRELASWFIQWYKTGVKPTISKNKIYWYYQTQPKNNAGTADSVGIPAEASQGQNNIIVVSQLTAAGTLSITTGGDTKTFPVPAGLSKTTTPFSVGAVKIQVGALGGDTGVPIVNSYAAYNTNIASGVFE